MLKCLIDPLTTECSHPHMLNTVTTYNGLIMLCSLVFKSVPPHNMEFTQVLKYNHSSVTLFDLLPPMSKYMESLYSQVQEKC